MERKNLYELYEKLYFHEVESKEKISSRLQIPLAILLSIIGVLSHIIKGVSLKCPDILSITFWLLFLLSISLFIISVSYFIRSFYGHSYQFLPSANETEEYRKNLIETYKEYEEGESLTEKYFSEYIYKYFNECSSANTKVNDLRSELLHKCNTFLILCSLPLVGTFLLFTFAGIDKNSTDKEYKVKVTAPIKIESEAQEVNIPSIQQPKESLNGQRASETSTTSATTSSQKSDKGRRSNSTPITTEEPKKIKEIENVKREAESTTSASTTSAN